MRVAVITVGDELLAGDIVNTNAAWLGEQLTSRGADVERIVVVPDRIEDIARVVNESRAEYDAVIVTGGLGPTHDDVTMDGIAAAVGRSLEPHEEAIRWIDENTGYENESLIEGTTDLPKGARMLPNEAGVAPGAVVGEDMDGVPIYVLPGVPDEMKTMFERIADEFEGTIREQAFLVADEPESTLIDRFETVREKFGVKIGSYPGETVRIKVMGEDSDAVTAAVEWLRERITEADEPAANGGAQTDTDDADS